MNGYVIFETPEGDQVAVNADRVSHVRRFKGGNVVSAINFEKGNYVIVKGSLEQVVSALSES